MYVCVNQQFIWAQHTYTHTQTTIYNEFSVEFVENFLYVRVILCNVLLCSPPCPFLLLPGSTWKHISYQRFIIQFLQQPAGKYKTSNTNNLWWKEWNSLYMNQRIKRNMCLWCTSSSWIFSNLDCHRKFYLLFPFNFFWLLCFLHSTFYEANAVEAHYSILFAISVVRSIQIEREGTKWYIFHMI